VDDRVLVGGAGRGRGPWWWADFYPRCLQGARAVSGPTCCCSVSLDRCDLLVDLEGFHLISVARTLVARSTLCWLSISGGEVIDSW